MKIIIIGAGKMGFSMAKMLSAEDHDVVVIEIKLDRQRVVNDLLDVQTIHGSGVSQRVLEAAGVKNTDMVLALTESDELNMVACLIAKQFNVKTTIARVRNTDYLESRKFSLEKLMGIDVILNPEQITAREIAQIVKKPEALNVDYYADGKVLMVELAVTPDNKIVSRQLKDLDDKLPYNIVSINRQHNTIVPRGNDVIMAGDYINLMAKTSEMSQVEKMLGFDHKKVEHVTILGGGRTGYYLAKMLEEQKPPVAIKIIEKSLERAREISEKLNNTLVIQGDGSDYELLETENVAQSDIFVAVSNDDQINLLCALIAKNFGVKKVIAQIKRTDLIPLAEQIGIDTTLSPRVLTAGAILKYIRKGEVISVTLMKEQSAEMIEFAVQPGAPAVNKKLMDLNFPRDAVIGAILREEKVIIPNGEVVIQTLDRLIVFCLPKSISKVEKLFMGPGKLL